MSTATAPVETVEHAPEAPHAGGGGHDGHSAAGRHVTHGGHGGHKKHAHEHKHHGPPPWLISFGDMMTLFLCFFVILVTMAPKQDAGLMARGLGPFVVALESHGMDGALAGSRNLDAINAYRARFGLAAITEKEYLEGRVEARNADEVKALLDQGLRPYSALPQPLVARFLADSAELPGTAHKYLDLIAEGLRPGFGQVLVLEGHAGDAAERFDHNNALLALARAQTVRQYLIDKLQFIPQRVEARAWVVQPDSPGGAPHTVDARLIQPVKREADSSE